MSSPRSTNNHQAVPWPADTTRSRRRRENELLGGAFVAALGALLGIPAVHSFLSGDVRDGVFFSAGALLFLGCGSALWVGNLERRRGEKDLRVDAVEAAGSRAVIVPPSKTRRLAAFIGLLAFGLPGALFLVMFGIGVDLLKEQDSDDRRLVAVVLLASPVVFVACYLVLRNMWGETFAVGSKGIFSGTSRRGEFYPWADIFWMYPARREFGRLVAFDVMDRRKSYLVGSRAERRRAKGVTGRPLHGVNVDTLAIEPGLVYYWLKFYHRNPALRVELETVRAVQRLRDRDFPIGSDVDEEPPALPPGAGATKPE